MIPSAQKVSQELFKSMLVKGRRYTSASFSATFSSGDKTEKPKFSVVVSKKIDKSAVKRNFMKRILYSLVRRFIKNVQPGTVCAIFLKKKLEKKDIDLVAVEIETFLNKSHLLVK